MPLPRTVIIALLCISLSVAFVADTRAADRFEAIDRYVETYQQMAAFDGVILIAEGDEVAWQKTYGMADYRFGIPMSADTRFRIASLSKQFTQAATGRLIDDGKLEFSTTLATFLPEFPAADQITVQQLVDHAAGIAHTNRMDWMVMTEPMSLDEIIESLSKEALLFSPGSDRQYSNGGYAVLAKIIELVSGKPYESFIEQDIAGDRFPGVGHESAFEVVPRMASRYAPGPRYGERVEADTYVAANRIGGGSLYATAADVYGFFRAGIDGQLLSEEASSVLFAMPDDGDTLITGRSPGALAQIYLHVDGLTVVTLSSNSAWPASFNRDIVSLYRGQPVDLISFDISHGLPDEAELRRVTGDFVAERFGWDARIEAGPGNLVYSRNAIRTAFARTTSGEYHLPIYDWLCRFADDGSAYTCRQRDPSSDIRFLFQRQRYPARSFW